MVKNRQKTKKKTAKNTSKKKNSKKLCKLKIIHFIKTLTILQYSPTFLKYKSIYSSKQQKLINKKINCTNNFWQINSENNY